MRKTLFICVLILFVLHFNKVFAEEAITEFDEKMAIGFFGNYRAGSFDQNESREQQTDLPWNCGAEFRYKNISAQLSVPLSFKDRALDFEIYLYFDKIYFEAFLKNYEKMYDANTNEQSGFEILSSGITATWVDNHEAHSLSSVLKMDKKQNKSSGSLLYGIGAFYTSIYSKTENFERYAISPKTNNFAPP